MTSNSSTIKNEQYGNYKKDVNEKTECTNKVRYIILSKIMYSLLKYVRKKMMMKLIRIKNDEDINKEKTIEGTNESRVTHKTLAEKFTSKYSKGNM